VLEGNEDEGLVLEGTEDEGNEDEGLALEGTEEGNEELGCDVGYKIDP
jgi:hypothetical protein